MTPITAKELLCPCCGTGAPHPQLIFGLNFIQDKLGVQLDIHSACRCPKHNVTVAGAAHSEHLFGDAADISAPERTPLQIYLAATEYEPFNHGGIGLYPNNSVHVDHRPTRARWFRIGAEDYPITDYLTYLKRS